MLDGKHPVRWLLTVLSMILFGVFWTFLQLARWLQTVATYQASFSACWQEHLALNVSGKLAYERDSCDNLVHEESLGVPGDCAVP